jgi:thioredoxin reductase (NADPH)
MTCSDDRPGHDRIRAGEVLYLEGDPSESFYVVLSGRVAMVEGYGTGEQRVVRVHGPGRFLGG